MNNLYIIINVKHKMTQNKIKCKIDFSKIETAKSRSKAKKEPTTRTWGLMTSPLTIKAVQISHRHPFFLKGKLSRPESGPHLKCRR